MKPKKLSAVVTAAALLLSMAALPCIPVYADDDDELMTDEVMTYQRVDGGVSIVDCAESTVKLYIPKDFMGYPIVSIGDEAFANCSKLQSLEIEAPITSIGANAFTNCIALKSLELPETVTKLGDAAFYNCNALENIGLPDSITEMGLYCFAYCFGLKEVTLPASLTKVPGYCFYYDFSLENVNLNANLEAIDTLAFVGCYVMKEIRIPAKVKEIAPLALLACAGLQKVVVDADNAAYQAGEDGILMDAAGKELLLYPAGKEGATYTVPDTVTAISYYAFSGSVQLKEVILPDSVTEIREGAFSDCIALTKVNIPEKVTSIENSAFADCAALVDFTIPQQITSIGEYAFFCCSSLTDITIPSGVKTIGDYAFTGCSGTADITVSETVTAIGDYAFGYLTEEDKETGEAVPVLWKDFTLRGHSSSAVKTYASKFNVRFKQTNFPVLAAMVVISALLVAAVAVVFVVDHRKRRALKPVAVDESAITDPEALQDAGYSSILAEEEEGDPFERSYGFRIDDPVDAEAEEPENKTEETE